MRFPSIIHAPKRATQPHHISQPRFIGSAVQDQPPHALRDHIAVPMPWWGKDNITRLTGAMGLYNVSSLYGFGIGHTPINYGTVPKFIDRASPFMWV